MGRKRQMINPFKILFEHIFKSKVYRFLYDGVKGIFDGVQKAAFKMCCNPFRQGLFSLCLAILLAVTCYIAENQPYNLLEKSLLYYLLEAPFHSQGKNLEDNVCFINVSHDRTMVNLDAQDSLSGCTDITDRSKLLSFLLKLEEEKVPYRYILMDIRFEKGLETAMDSLLFNQILGMRDIVIAHHMNDAWDNYEIADPRLIDKAGLSDYHMFGFVSNFSRYSFLQNKIPSIALKMYDDVMNQSTSIRQLWSFPVYFSNRHLCANSPMLFISGNVYDKTVAPKQKDGNLPLMPVNFYMDLGSDILNLEGRNFNADFGGKFIVIGDFEHDIHDTYSGRVPGAYINWAAFQHLRSGRHILSWSFVFFTLLGYFLIIYFLFYINNVSLKVSYVNDKKAQSLLLLMRWIGSVGLMYFVTFISYKWFSVRYNITVPLIFIAITNFIIQIVNKKIQ